MLELIVGVAIGAGGMMIKDKVLTSQEEASSAKLQNELNNLSDENEKLRKRNKEAERSIEDLLQEVQSLHKKAKSNNDDCEDLEDVLQTAKNTIKKLTAQNDELLRKISEYKTLCQNYESKLDKLKNS